MVPMSLPDLDAPGPRAELYDPAATIRFLLAGNAYVTFQSRRTGDRFTYHVVPAELSMGERAIGRMVHFVSVLVGPDNSRSYQFLGTIFDGRAYAHGRRSKIDSSATSAVAFTWVWSKLVAGAMHPLLAVYHEGRCGRCGRRLTTPRSIEIGLGPKCEKRG